VNQLQLRLLSIQYFIMRIATFFALSNVLLGVIAGPLVAKRQGELPIEHQDI
jgi:hypothetical protein